MVYICKSDLDHDTRNLCVEQLCEQTIDGDKQLDEDMVATLRRMVGILEGNEMGEYVDLEQDETLKDEFFAHIIFIRHLDRRFNFVSMRYALVKDNIRKLFLLVGDRQKIKGKPVYKVFTKLI